MADIDYIRSAGTGLALPELLDLYNTVGWTSYTETPERLAAALKGSHLVVAARTGEQLVGLARVISDGASIWYLQDLLVRPEFQRCGIGRELVRQALLDSGGVRQKVLLTDDEPGQKAFYEALGFQQTTEFRGGTTRAFVRFD
ncbi:MAG: GNAT family N-acetyltransferase [Specibacter sp.]